MRKPIIIAIAAATMALSGFGARADQLQDGASAFQNGNYTRALASWRPLANQGNPVAQNNLGIMYLDGKGVPQNYAEGIRWYKLAAAQDNAAAMSNLGFMFEHGLGVEIDEAQALQYVNKAARNGDPNALKNRDIIEARIAARQPHTP